MGLRDRLVAALGGVAREVPSVAASPTSARGDLDVARHEVDAEQRMATQSSYAAAFAAGIEQALSGRYRLSGTRRAAFSNSALVYAAMKLIAQSVAAVLPFKLWRPAPIRSDWQEVASHPILDRLDDPNRDLYSDGSQFIEMMVMFMLGGGNAWLWQDPTVNSKTRTPNSLAVFGLSQVQPYIDPQTWRLLGWTFRFGAQPRQVQPDYFSQIKFSNPDDGSQILGLGPVQAAQTVLDSSFARERYEDSFFVNGADPGTVLKFNPGEIGARAPLTKDDMLVARELWRDEHEGVDKAHKVAMLNAGWSLEKTGMSQRDMQFVQAELNTLRKIGFVFGIPSVKLNDFEHAGLSREGFEVGNRALATDVIVPICKRLSLFLTRALVKPIAPELVGEFDTSTIPALREDQDKKIDRVVKLVSIGICPNKAIKFEDLGIEPEPWGDEAFISGGDRSASLIAKATTLPGDLGGVPLPPETGKPLMPEGAPLPQGKMAGLSTPSETRQAESADLAELREQARAWRWRAIISGTEPLEQRLERKFVRFFKRLGRETLDNLKARLSRAVKPVEQDLRAILFDRTVADDEIRAFCKPFFERAIRLGSTTVAGELHTVPLGIDSDAAQAALRLKEIKVVDINGTIADELRSSLIDGFDAGETLPDLAARVRDVFDASLARSHTIARTEIADGLSQGRFVEMQAQGVVEQEWMSARDDHVRQPPKSEFDHAIDGETVTLGEPFSNGLLYPHDPDGDPGNVIGCRCVAIATSGSAPSSD